MVYSLVDIAWEMTDSQWTFVAWDDHQVSLWMKEVYYYYDSEIYISEMWELGDIFNDR